MWQSFWRLPATRWIFVAVGVSASTATPSGQATTDPWPTTIDRFTAAVQQVLTETGVPGAGVALVRRSGIEWAGGIGVADRDNGTKVTADTRFRAGSLSKTFIAMALAQMEEHDEIDLNATVAELAPEIPIDNAWNATDPVRVIHLLQHSAGFDDNHFNEVFGTIGAPDLPLADVLRFNPASRVVRWRPGTRMSYSNPGYAVAGYLIEKVGGQKYEDRIAERIFRPVGMANSSLYFRPEDHATLAKAYTSRGGPPVPYTPVFLRPAGSLLTTASDMGKFVRLLLNRGEAPAGRVIGPEHLSIMQRPRTTLAATAGLRTGYGAGLATYDVDGFPLLVHSGGIEGFSSLFGYSTSHDAGFVVLLNSNVSGAARLRIASLAVRYLTAAVDPPVGAMATVSADRLRSHAGYYHDANPRMQATAFLSWLLSGQTITVNGARLRSVSIAGDTIDLIPVSETSFRRPDESEATHVFTVNEHGVAVLAGGIAGQLYAERRPRWQLEIVRVPVVLSAGLVLTPLVMLMPWTVQACRATPPTFWRLKVCLLISAFTSLVSGLAFMAAGGRELGTPTIWSVSFCLGTILLPATSVLTLACIFHVWCAGEGRWLRAYAIVIAVAGVIISVYLFRWGMIGFRSWAY